MTWRRRVREPKWKKESVKWRSCWAKLRKEAGTTTNTASKLANILIKGINDPQELNKTVTMEEISNLLSTLPEDKGSFQLDTWSVPVKTEGTPVRMRQKTISWEAAEVAMQEKYPPFEPVDRTPTPISVEEKLKLNKQFRVKSESIPTIKLKIIIPARKNK